MQIALQAVQKIHRQFTCVSHVNRAATGLHTRIQPRHIARRRRGIVQRQRPRVILRLYIVKKLQFTLFAQRKLRHGKARALFFGRAEMLRSLGAACCARLCDGFGCLRRVRHFLQCLHFIVRPGFMNGQHAAVCIPFNFCQQRGGDFFRQFFQCRLFR